MENSSAIKKELLAHHNSITLSKKSQILYDSIYITLLKYQYYRNGEQISGCQGLKVDGDRRKVVVYKRVT